MTDEDRGDVIEFDDVLSLALAHLTELPVPRGMKGGTLNGTLVTVG